MHTKHTNKKSIYDDNDEEERQKANFSQSNTDTHTLSLSLTPTHTSKWYILSFNHIFRQSASPKPKLCCFCQLTSNWRLIYTYIYMTRLFLDFCNQKNELFVWFALQVVEIREISKCADQMNLSCWMAALFSLFLRLILLHFRFERDFSKVFRERWSFSHNYSHFCI